MSRTFTLSALVTKAKQRTDMENQDNIGSSEWKSMLSTSYAQLCGLIASTGLRYFESTESITATGATSYTAPAAHLSTIGVDFVINAQGERRELFELMVQERNLYAGQTGEAMAWALVGDQMFLYPNPTTGSYKWIYVPQPTDLNASADSASIDVVTPDGESFLLWDVAVQVAAKEETDPSLAIREREAARERVLEWGVLRALNNPRRRQVDSTDATSCTDAADYWGRG